MNSNLKKINLGELRTNTRAKTYSAIEYRRIFHLAIISNVKFGMVERILTQHIRYTCYK